MFKGKKKVTTVDPKYVLSSSDKFKDRSIITEREVTLKATDLPQYKSLILDMPVSQLMKGRGTPLILQTRMFYANIHNINWDTPSFTTHVDGCTFDVNKSTICHVLRLQDDPSDIRIKPDTPFTDRSDEWREIATSISYSGTSMKKIELSKVPKSIRHYAAIVSTNIVPTTATSSYFYSTTAEVLHHIISKHMVDWGSFIVEMMLWIHNSPKKNLGFPRLVNLLCLNEGILSKERPGVLPTPFSIKTITLATSHLKGKGVEQEEDVSDHSTEPSEFGEILRERIEIMVEEKKERAKKIARQVKRESNLKKIIIEDLQELSRLTGVVYPVNSQRSQLLQDLSGSEDEFEEIDKEDA